jgi:uncharacterized protein YigA (DUF484 family)
MNRNRLNRRAKSAEMFATECEEEIRRMAMAREPQEIATNPNETQVLVYHENEREVRSHDIVSIGIGDDKGTLVFTDIFGDSYTQDELAYTSSTYPDILSLVMDK